MIPKISTSIQSASLYDRHQDRRTRRLSQRYYRTPPISHAVRTLSSHQALYVQYHWHTCAHHHRLDVSFTSESECEIKAHGIHRMYRRPRILIPTTIPYGVPTCLVGVSIKLDSGCRMNTKTALHSRPVPCVPNLKLQAGSDSMTSYYLTWQIGHMINVKNFLVAQIYGILLYYK